MLPSCVVIAMEYSFFFLEKGWAKVCDVGIKDRDVAHSD
jgi:hypothetical protein